MNQRQFREYQMLRTEIDIESRRIQHLESLTMACPEVNKLFLCEITYLKLLIYDHTQKALMRLTSIANEIRNIDNVETRLILMYKYEFCESWQAIERDIKSTFNLDISQIKKIHDRYFKRQCKGENNGEAVGI